MNKLAGCEIALQINDFYLKISHKNDLFLI